MSIFAMSLSSLLCSEVVSSHHIFKIIDYFKMFWIDTRPISTKMINLHAPWYRANHLLVHPAVGINLFLIKSK